MGDTTKSINVYWLADRTLVCRAEIFSELKTMGYMKPWWPTFNRFVGGYGVLKKRYNESKKSMFIETLKNSKETKPLHNIKKISNQGLLEHWLKHKWHEVC